MYFIRFLLIAILALYIIRSLVRILLPMLFQSLVNKAQQQGQQQQQYRRPQNQPEGKVKVDYVPQTKQQVSDSAGDFVDFEEIK